MAGTTLHRDCVAIIIIIITLMTRCDAIFTRPPRIDERGRPLLTTLPLARRDTIVPAGARHDEQPLVFAPWYLGDSVTDASTAFCIAVADAGVSVGAKFRGCVSQVTQLFLTRVQDVFAKVVELSDATPNLQPVLSAAVGVVDAVEGQ